VGLALVKIRKKIPAVPYGLHKHECTVQNQRNHPGKNQLRRRIKRAGCGGRKIRQDQRKRDQGGQYRQCCGSAERLKPLLIMANAAGDEAQSDHAVADQHDRCEHRVARQPRFIGGAADHHREDQRYFDHSDGNGEHQGSERLANPVGNHFRVVNRGEDRQNQTCPSCGS